MVHLKKETGKNFNLFLFGDTHIGNTLCYYGGIESLIAMGKKPYGGLTSAKKNFFVFHGDAIDAICSDDKRFSYESVEQSVPLQQANKAIKIFSPIKKQIVVWLDGNHEDTLKRFGDLALHIAKGLDVPYGTYSSHISYTHKGDVLFRHFATHGRLTVKSTADDPIRRIANERLILKRQLKDRYGDTILMSKGHTHKIINSEPEGKLYFCEQSGRAKQHYTHHGVGQNKKYIHPDNRYYVNTGSFMKLYAEGFSGYAEKAEYPPVELGFCIARVRDGGVVGLDKVVL